MNISTAQQNYYSRPADERFETLAALKAAVAARTEASSEENFYLRDLHVEQYGDSVALSRNMAPVKPTHWSFGQLANIAGAPAAYLRNLPSDLTVKCLNLGLERAVEENEDAQLKVMSLRDTKGRTSDTLRALTSTGYGRIFDLDCIQAVENFNEETGNRFSNPPNWEKRPDGLYASDRDIFLFQIDGGSIVNAGGDRDQLHRGFFVSNSEVGNAAFSVTTFLFRGVCGNLMIWGATDVNSLRIVHTHLAPKNFTEKAMPALLNFMNSSTKPIEQAIKRAKTILLPADEKELITTFQVRKFSRNEILTAKRMAIDEEGQCETIWDLAQGLTAQARSIPHIDARVDLQKRAGKLMELVTI